MDYARKFAFIHNEPPTPYKIKLIWWICWKESSSSNSSNFNATILKFSEQFIHPYSHVFIFGNMFPESHGFVAIPVTSCIKDTWCFNLSLSNYYWKETKLLDLVTGTATKPWLSGNMLPNWNTCEYRWSNFLENLRIVSLKLLELTQFPSKILSIDFYCVRCWGPLWCCWCSYPEWPHGQWVGLVFRRSHDRDWLSAASLVICSPASIAVCNTWSSGGTALCRVVGATRQLDIPSLTPLSVAGCGWPQLGAPHCATSVDHCKLLMIEPTFCGSSFSIGRLLAIEDFTFTLTLLN